MYPAVMKSIEDGFVVPTNEDLIEFKNHVGWSTNDLARSVDINPKNLRDFLNEKSYIRGRRINYAPWRLWLESFGFLKPIHKAVRRHAIESGVFNRENWQTPFTQDLRLLVNRSGNSNEFIAELLDKPVPLIHGLIESSENKPFKVDKNKWFEFLDKINIRSIDEFVQPPVLFPASLLRFNDGYEAPNPKQLRQFVAWSGYNIQEMSSFFGLDEAKWRFYTSNRSYRESDVSLHPKLFSRENWSLPYMRELRALINISKTDPDRVAQILKMDRKEIMKCLKSPHSKKVYIQEDDWFTLLETLGYFSAEMFNKQIAHENSRYTIPYAPWRLMLQSFGLVKPEALVKPKRKQPKAKI